MKWILVTGSRDFGDYDLVYAGLSEAVHGLGWSPEAGGMYRVVCGDCPTGADAMAKYWTPESQFIEFAADWDTYGKKAGPIRNKQMVDFLASQEGEKVCLSYWRTGAGNRGTRNCVALALEAGIEVKRFWN